MQMTIFLDLDEARFLNELMPPACQATRAITRAMQAREYWGFAGRNVIIQCDDSDGLDLLKHAEALCPTAADKIRSALQIANQRGRHTW